jgi:hypothetical protein
VKLSDDPLAGKYNPPPKVHWNQHPQRKFQGIGREVETGRSLMHYRRYRAGAGRNEAQAKAHASRPDPQTPQPDSGEDYQERDDEQSAKHLRRICRHANSTREIKAPHGEGENG